MSTNYQSSTYSAAAYRRFFVVAFATFAMAQLAPSSVHAQYVDWVRQLGTATVDGFWGVSADASGTIYAVGDTAGSIFATQQGGGDALLAKYDAAGNLLGGKQDGTSVSDQLTVAVADGAGGVYVGGSSSTGLFGPPRVGTGNNLFGHIDAANNWTWLQQSATDSVQGGGGASTGLFLTAGTTFAAVAGPYAGGGDTMFSVRNLAGSVIQQRQFGSTGFDGGNAGTIDSFGNYFVAGVTTGALVGPNAGGADAYIAKYDAAGTQLWIKQLGSAVTDASTSVVTDAGGNVYVAGITDGAIGGPNAGSSDNFVAKYDPAGNLLWTQQLGSAAAEFNPLVTYFLGGVWVSSSTYGSLFGPSAGNLDVYAARLDAGSGSVLWSTQLGTANAEHALAITVDPFIGKVYVAGITNGSFGGPHAGSDDAFLLAINGVPSVPEPTTLAIGSAGALLAVCMRGTRRCVARRRSS